MTVSLTAAVFCVWWAYLHIFGSERRNLEPLHIAGVGYVREGKLVERIKSSTSTVEKQSNSAPADFKADTEEKDKATERRNPYIYFDPY